MEQNSSTLESTLKSSDTEEPIDIYFYRPIGYRCALLCQKLGITPNVITIASMFIGVAAGVCFYFENNIWITLLGIFLLVWANTFDSVDGQLARMTKNFSKVGRILDGFAGDLWFAAIYIAICLRTMDEWGWWIWLTAVVTGFFHSKQASIADYYRNIHLLFLKGKSGSELDSSADLTKEYKSLSWNKKEWFDKIVAFFYASYTRGQENWTPDFQKMLALIKDKFGDTAPEQFRKDFRAKSLPLMKWTNILSFNTRAIVLCLSMLIGFPWVYFVFELTVLNIILIYMISSHEKMSRQFSEKIMQGAYN
ncbi:MAG: CDP-alcohol phosphatidyltransferase family protein [Dysgonomonas sp.]